MTRTLYPFKDYVRCLGSSSDGRTNKWKVTCPICGRDTVPSTTILADQGFYCEKSKRCRDASTWIYIQYNEEKLIVS